MDQAVNPDKFTSMEPTDLSCAVLDVISRPAFAMNASGIMEKLASSMMIALMAPRGDRKRRRLLLHPCSLYSTQPKNVPAKVVGGILRSTTDVTI